MKHDSLAKTTRIPFKVVSGKLVHFYDGKPITELREGCSGDIVIEDFKIEGRTRVLQYNAGAEVDFLPSGTRILARVNSTNVPAELRERLSEEGSALYRSVQKSEQSHSNAEVGKSCPTIVPLRLVAALGEWL